MADRKLMIEVSEVLPLESRVPDSPQKEDEDDHRHGQCGTLFFDIVEASITIFIV